MFIGQLAELTGCTPKAIRLYEEMGLVKKPNRKGRYRIYDAQQLKVVELIRKAQVAGFKLSEIPPLIVAKNKPNAIHMALANEAIEMKRQQLKEKIRILKCQQIDLAKLKREIVLLHAGFACQKNKESSI
jgi:DNA-binding transcriptional MerR regulator